METLINYLQIPSSIIHSISPKKVHDDGLFRMPIWKHVPPVFFGIFYLLMLVFWPKIQRKYMFMHKNKKAMKMVFIVWNFFLSIYSSINVIFGFSEMPYFIFTTFKDQGSFLNRLFMLVCHPGCPSYDPTRATTFFGDLFIWSKYFELGDTFLLILKKPNRKLSFLHCYHHFSVMFATHYAHVYKFAPGYLYGLMNSIVHMFMYYYFAVAEMGYRPSWAFMLTVGQTSQMFFGLVFTGMWMYGRKMGYGCCCDNVIPLFTIFAVIYSSYLVLFLKFMVKKYFKPKNKKEEEKSSDKNGMKEHQH